MDWRGRVLSIHYFSRTRLNLETGFAMNTPCAQVRAEQNSIWPEKEFRSLFERSIFEYLPRRRREKNYSMKPSVYIY